MTDTLDIISNMTTQSSSTMQGMKNNSEEHLRIMKSQIDQLELENARLVEQFTKVMRMNSYWQRYITILREQITFSN